MDQWDAAIDWCTITCGEVGIDWAHSGSEMQISSLWWFKTNEHAVQFALTWC